MFEFSNPILLITAVIALLCGGFVYFFMNRRINSMEEDMSNMFNLLSSLNEEQKRLGNLVVYSLQQPPLMSHQPLNTNNLVVMEEIDDKIEIDTPALTLEQVDSSQEEPIDHRVIVSDDEDTVELTEQLFSDSVKLILLNKTEETEETEETKQSVKEIISFQELNKLKVNELKEYLDTIDLPRDVLIKAKKLKKKEMMDFILSFNGSDTSDTTDTPIESDEDEDEENDAIFEGTIDTVELSEDEQLNLLDTAINHEEFETIGLNVIDVEDVPVNSDEQENSDDDK